jgi:glycosyltransferase involved in cell wall biosynthesis
MKNENYILWLPSWYPNKYEPTNGDFVQRHAYATSQFCKVTLLHFTQLGEDIFQPSTYESTTITGQLTEIISYIAFRPIGIKPVDKLRYNFFFYKHAKRYLTSYFANAGLPSKVHVHVPMKAGILALWIKKKFGVDYIVSEHSSYYSKNAPGNYFERHLLYKQQVKTIFQKASLVTNVSAAVGRILSDLFQLNQLKTIHNVVNTDYFYYSKKRSDVFTYIHVSVLNDQKNINGILRTFGQLRLMVQDWKLLLVGPYTEHLKQKVRELDLQDYVEFTGEVAYEQVAVYMKQSHVKVLFSKHENFPCTIIEALCCGLPVVASNIAGVHEAVDDSNGFLVPPNDERRLLEALIKVKEHYVSFDLERISQNAIGKYNYNVIGRQIFNLYSNNSRS